MTTIPMDLNNQRILIMKAHSKRSRLLLLSGQVFFIKTPYPVIQLVRLTSVTVDGEKTEFYIC
jgi:hypothetical protein